MIVVSDSSPLISLARVEQIELLQQLYSEVLIPPAVDREIRSRKDRADVRSLAGAHWIKVFSPDPKLSTALYQVLDRGEAEAIVLALDVKADFLLIDERLGRRIAENMGLRVVGLLGVLVEAKQKNLISKLKPLLDQLRANSFWTSDALYHQILRTTGEE